MLPRGGIVLLRAVAPPHSHLRSSLLPFSIPQIHICLAHAPLLQFSSTASTRQQLKPREESGGQMEVSRGEKAKEGAKTASYSLVILAGLGMCGTVFYTVFRELFSSNSANSLYDKAVADCLAHEKLADLLGEPIKAFGEENRRHRRTHVAKKHYVDPQGRAGVRIQFYLQGVRNKGTAQLDAREDSGGRMQTRFLVVEIDNLLRNTVVVVDNRGALWTEGAALGGSESA